MDVIATRQAAAFVKRWIVEEKRGPLLVEFVHVPLRWVFAINNEARAEVGEAQARPEPAAASIWHDLYCPGTEPPFIRGGERDSWKKKETSVLVVSVVLVAVAVARSVRAVPTAVDKTVKLLVLAGNNDDDVPEPEAMDIDEFVDEDESEQVNMPFWVPVHNKTNSV
ncbi:hypothetical protein FISHEDRAFT_75165 [Fistulina hepatica ATCC 64428]|uniref:Uncharacterized protein n=1 Tax=Fistulina hepatica ATCC 64428 TaxID=1128425 RepID=A0A0D7A940_9AGAR|nr:hypothetical protein FISHEDRAFT_75165 [Fistulina hepatica ATCC 64428]